MQKEWTDPRDRSRWLVTVTPFGSSAGDNSSRTGDGSRTIAFHQPGHRPAWTRYPLNVPLHEAGDQALMDLLDTALRAGGGRPARRAGENGREESA